MVNIRTLTLVLTTSYKPHQNQQPTSWSVWQPILAHNTPEIWTNGHQQLASAQPPRNAHLLVIYYGKWSSPAHLLVTKHHPNNVGLESWQLIFVIFWLPGRACKVKKKRPRGVLGLEKWLFSIEPWVLEKLRCIFWGGTYEIRMDLLK